MLARSVCRSIARKTNGGPLRSGGVVMLPPGAIFRTVNGVDVIGKSISELYPLVSPELQSIISADGGETKRTDTQIVDLGWDSPWLNAGTMIGRDGIFLAIYPHDTPDDILLKALRYAKIIAEAVSIYGEQILIDGSAAYIGVHA